MHSHSGFDEQLLLSNLKHYLPAQAPLKDFVHHNTLHEFQDQKFHDGVAMASKMLGYKVYLSLDEYRSLYKRGIIRDEVLDRVIRRRMGERDLAEWRSRLFSDTAIPSQKRIGQLREHWKQHYHFDLNGRVHVNLFRLLNSYLDQGVAIWQFPVLGNGFLDSVRQLEKNSYSGFLRTRRARTLLHDEHLTIRQLLDILVGDETLYEHYVFDQQFEHPGWSGLVAVIEDQPHTLLDRRTITLRDLILLELILEIDTLDKRFGSTWKPLVSSLVEKPDPLFRSYVRTVTDEVNAIWQEAYEWSYYDEVLAGLKTERPKRSLETANRFFAFFCIDDREISLRQYIESLEKNCQTFSTPGHFAIDAYYEPQNGRFHTKICPVPLNPKHLIREQAPVTKRKKEVHFTRTAHHPIGGWIIAQTVGFWTAIRLFLNVFRPTISPASSSAFRHMDEFATLTVENQHPRDRKGDLQIGYTLDEMTDRVESVLRSTGAVRDFAPLVYMIGHGASSTNNTHFAAYDCGACSGRPGSVNSRAFSVMANHPGVRENLAARGIHIPPSTVFVGGLHDTTCDEIRFYDLDALTADVLSLHRQNERIFTAALRLNAKERSRRFDLVSTQADMETIHRKVRQRAVALFEPRPEYNHATNTLCIIGRRDLTHNLFLDRRAFLNSYDYSVDPEGKHLLGILNAAAPVCGGINLEYYFSRTDNQKLGAGSKLSHNVMGLIGVANGTEGDLRPGLPQQMIEIHDPLRLLIVVEHFPEIVRKVIQTNPATYEWFDHEWVNLIVVDPGTKEFHRFTGGAFERYDPTERTIPGFTDPMRLIESSSANLPVFTIQKATV